jgi:hypothetical protein
MSKVDFRLSSPVKVRNEFRLSTHDLSCSCQGRLGKQLTQIMELRKRFVNVTADGSGPHSRKSLDEAVFIANGLKPGVERSGAPGMGIVCEQALKARLEIRFGIEVALAQVMPVNPAISFLPSLSPSFVRTGRAFEVSGLQDSCHTSLAQ